MLAAQLDRRTDLNFSSSHQKAIKTLNGFSYLDDPKAYIGTHLVTKTISLLRGFMATDINWKYKKENKKRARYICSFVP